MSELKQFDEFMDALVNCDTVKVALTGLGESVFDTKTIYDGIKNLALESRADHSGEGNKWISVEDRLPEPGERVIATNGAIVLEMHRRLFNQEMCWARYGIKLEDFYGQVTHWMPLPEPPIDFAIQTIADCASVWARNMPPQKHGARSDPFETAIKALREKKDRENNAPLTLDELRGMAGEPVYLVYPNAPELDGWQVLKCVDGEPDEDGSMYAWFTDDMWHTEDYGDGWLAYRQKPEGGEGK